MAAKRSKRKTSQEPAPVVRTVEPERPTWVASAVQFGFIGIAALAVYGFVGMAKEGELRRRCTPLCGLSPQYAGAARKVPSFTLPDLDGKSVSLESYRGKVLVLNFWSITCEPCREEMPALAELTTLMKKRGDVEVITITTDEDPASVRDFLRAVLRDDAPFSVLMDPERKVVGGQFGTNLVPETWIVDARGVVRARFDGQRDWTSGLVTQFLDQVRDGSYCPLEIQGRSRSGEGAFVCQKAN